MKCKVCGANNEDYLEYCENCAAPLNESAGTADNTGGMPREERTWGFVASPDWSKPDFSANTVSEEDIPTGFQPQSFRPRFNAAKGGPAPAAPQAPAPQQAQPKAPSSVRRDAEQSQSGSKRNSVRTYAKPAAVCPSCGAALTPGQRFCNSCGQKLEETAPARAAAPAVSTAPIAASAAAGGIKYADPLDEDMFSFSYDDEEEERPRRKKNVKKASAPARPVGGAKRSRKRSGLAVDKSMIYWIAAGVLVIAMIVMGVVLANKTYGSVGGFFASIFDSSPVTKEPVIEKITTENGDPAYNITIYAKRGSTVRFTGGTISKDIPVESSKPIILSVPEAVWIPSEPVETDKLEVFPDITVISKDGTETPVAFAEPIVIDIPTLSLSVTAPNTPTFETAAADVTFSGVVGDPTSAVYVNDMQLTVDESGAFEGAYTLTAEGENTVNVEARKNGYAIARQTFTVNYGTTAPSTTTPGAAAPGTTAGGTAAPGAMPAGATAVGYVTTDGLKIRSQPNADSDDTVLGTLPLNTKIYIVEKDAGNSWAKVLYNGSEAYASNLYINLVDTYTVKDATITTDKLKGRASGSSSGEVVVEFPLNTKVSYIKDVGSGWSMIEYDGKILFAATQYLSIS